MIVHGTGRALHDKRLQKVLQRICEKGLTSNKEKCQYGVTKLTFVGHVLSEELKSRKSRIRLYKILENQKMLQKLGPSRAGKFHCQIQSP